MMSRLPLALLATGVLGACRGIPQEEPKPVEEPPKVEIVPPPVVRLAAEEEMTVVELLELPDEEPIPVVYPRPEATEISEERQVEYDRAAKKSIVELQPWRQTVELAPGLVLTDLHPRFHRQLLLTHEGTTWSIENRKPSRARCSPRWSSLPKSATRAPRSSLSGTTMMCGSIVS